MKKERAETLEGKKEIKKKYFFIIDIISGSHIDIIVLILPFFINELISWFPMDCAYFPFLHHWHHIGFQVPSLTLLCWFCLSSSMNSFQGSPWIVLIFPFFIIDIILGFRFPHWHYCADFAFLHQWTHFRVPHGLCLFSLSSSLTSYWVPSWTILYLFCLHFFWRGWEKWVCMTNRMCCANHSIQGMFCETTVFQNILWNHSIKFVHNTDHHFS